MRTSRRDRIAARSRNSALRHAILQPGAVLLPDGAGLLQPVRSELLPVYRRWLDARRRPARRRPDRLANHHPLGGIVLVLRRFVFEVEARFGGRIGRLAIEILRL